MLGRPEFQERHDPLDSWLQRLLDWVGGHGVAVPAWVTWLLFAVMALLLARFLAGWLARHRPALAAAPRKTAPASVVEVTRGAALTFSQAMELARRAAAEGDLRQALWIGHRLLLLRLDERGRLRFADGKTNGDYLREAPQERLLQELTDLYDRVVYGHRAVSGEEVAARLEAVERL